MCKVFLAKFLIYISLGESSFSLSRDISRMAVFGTLSDSRKNSRKENDGWDLLFSEEWKNESLGYSHLSQSIYVSFLLVGLGYITLTIDNTQQTIWRPFWNRLDNLVSHIVLSTKKCLISWTEPSTFCRVDDLILRMNVNFFHLCNLFGS